MRAGEKAILFGLGALTAAALLLGGCPPTPRPQPDGPVVRARDMAPLLYPTCVIPDGGALPKTADICVGLETPDHRICARCPVGAGCLDALDRIYCIAASTCRNTNGDSADPMCRP